MNWVDVVVWVCLGVGVVKGLFDGLVRQVVSLVALVLAFIFSGTLAGMIRNTVHWETSFSPVTMNAIYYVSSFILIIIIFGILGRFVNKVINYTPVGVLNRLGGGAFGFIICLLSLSFVLNVLAAFNMESKIIHPETQEKSMTYIPVKRALPVVYPYIKEFFSK